jgi:hypothetical protein
MKNISKLLLLFLLCSLSGKAQVLSKTGIAKGRILYYETFDKLSEMLNREPFFFQSTFQLKNMTTGTVVQARDSLVIDTPACSIRKYFIDNSLVEQQDCRFILAINDCIFISTDTTTTAGVPSLKIDIKPSLDATKAQELDVNWDYKNNAGLRLNAKGYFSTIPDFAALNSIQWSIGYQYALALSKGFKYFGIKGQVGGEHPQDFSQSNIVGSFSLSTVLPWTDQLARFIAGDDKDASLGILIQPAVDLVWKTTVKDSSYLRGAVHGNWNIPIRQGQYISLYGVAYFQDKFRPRSYIELSVTQNISSSLDVIVKWINGELPPLFQRDADLRIGLSFKK